ncbi:peptidase [Komarekiella sp. 'clone 1']|uniref:Peptidase n=1 Tax=Komarekiella delphini-convector SJRDD-AB1 TaxID=2593771 RepID=A0AA40SYD1_9NOST|nr:peptidase [Komarekiella delphini-convector]MBD6617272.1 peptidase [Komarekiella delphini-convector SJRDD-AB1]
MGNRTQYPKPNTLRNLIKWRSLAALALAIGTGLLLILANLQLTNALTKAYLYDGEFRNSLSLSPLLPHPLPPTLTQWQDNTNSGDYFSQITKTQIGYLIWSQFPIRVYVEPPKIVSEKQAQAWANCVLQAVQEWSTYLPLKVVEQPELADIKILRKTPPLEISRGDNVPRARSALTSYELYLSNNKVLSHRFTILLSPTQTGNYLTAAVRHEFGHALGIWGHSPLETDALYFSQVRNPPPISPRDVNTLKRVYEQPTNLGWSLQSPES